MTSYGTAWVREPAVRRREICGVYDKRDAAYDKYVPTAARTPAPPTRFAPGLVKQAASKVGVIGGTYLDPLYLPAHVRCAFSCDELAQLATVGRQLVDAETGRVAVRPGDVRLLLAAAGGPAGPARCAACVSRVGCSVEKPAGFADVIVWVATSRTAILDFTRKAARGARVQLPPCCTNAACTGVAPSCFAAKLDDLTPEQIAIYTVFCGAARDGLVAKADVARVLEAYGVDAYGKGLDSNEVDDVFNLYDGDGSGALDFDEFCALMQSFDAVGAVARRRGSAYGLTPEQRGDYSDAEVVLLSHHFGIFDKDGSGGIDAKELRGALDALGFAVSPEKLRTLLTIADADRSGVVEFGEFAALMRRLGDGSLLLDALPNTGFSAREMQKHGVPLGRLNLAADFEKLQELGIGEYPPFLVDVQTAATEPEPSVYATFAGSTLAGTPYAGRAVKLCIRATELYPLTAPVAFFTCRLVHLNCDVRLDGTARPSQLLREWVSGASLEELLRRAHALLVEPDADLFHRAQAALRAPPSDTSGPPGMDLRCSRRASKFTADVGALFEQNRPAYDALVRIEAVKALEKWDAAPKPQIEPA